MMMTPLRSWALALAVTASFAAPYLTEPALCPTRPELVFVSGGDIWLAPAQGGEAHLLVSHPATESRPLYSPDGKRLAFVSTRTGNGDIYVLTLATGQLQRLTWDDGLDQLDNWSRDGQWIYFSSGSRDVGRKNDLMRVRATGGTPMAVSADRFVNEFQAAPSPDGASLAFTARGNGDSQWWRNGHSHLDESEIWLWNNGQYKQLIDRQGRNHWPMWSADGREVFFMSDRGGTQNLWKTPAANSAPKPLTKFTSGRVLWPSIAYDGRAIVFEHDFRIWRFDTKTNEAAAVPLTLVGSAAGPAVTRLPLTTFSDFEVSPDDKKLAIAGHGEIFAASVRDGGEALRVTATPGPEAQMNWSPDSTRLVYVSQRDAINHVYLYDFKQRKETALTSGPDSDQAPRFSPDGKSIAYLPPAASSMSSTSKPSRTASSSPARSAAASAHPPSPGRPTASGSPTPPRVPALCATSTSSPPPAASLAKSASSPTPAPTASLGPPTASSSCSAPASAPKPARSPASTWWPPNRNSAKIASTTSSNPAPPRTVSPKHRT